MKTNGHHAWIEYRPTGGIKRTYGKWRDGILVDKDKNLGLEAIASKGKYLTNLQEAELFKYMNDKKNQDWSYTDNCANFAIGAWRAATGEVFKARASTMGVVNPKALSSVLPSGDILPNPPGSGSASSSLNEGSLIDFFSSGSSSNGSSSFASSASGRSLNEAATRANQWLQP
jgi:hypothetical protein